MPYRNAGSQVVSTVSRRLGSLRRFGLELEVCYASNNDSLVSPFGIKSDGSVHGDGLEFYSPILQGDDGLEAVENLCNYAAEHNWRVDDSCGYHLHIDTTDTDPSQRKRIFLAYKLTEKLWYSFCNEYRIDSDWCNPIPHTADEIRALGWRENVRLQWDRLGRYSWCNIGAWESHRTIEIRLHEGTLDKRTVCNWIKAHLRFADYVKDLPMSRITRIFEGKTKAAQFRKLEEIWGSEHLSRFYRRRARGLNLPAEQTV